MAVVDQSTYGYKWTTTDPVPGFAPTHSLPSWLESSRSNPAPCGLQANRVLERIRTYDEFEEDTNDHAPVEEYDDEDIPDPVYTLAPQSTFDVWEAPIKVEGHKVVVETPPDVDFPCRVFTLAPQSTFDVWEAPIKVEDHKVVVETLPVPVHGQPAKEDLAPHSGPQKRLSLSDLVPGPKQETQRPHAQSEHKEKPDVEKPKSNDASLQKGTVTCDRNGSETTVTWIADASTLGTKSKHMVSSLFSIHLAGKEREFLITIRAKREGGKAGEHFNTTRGCGELELQLRGELEKDIVDATASYSISIGSGNPKLPKTVQHPRQLADHNFKERCTSTLSQGRNIWDFRQSVDKSAQLFVVCVKFQSSH
jgi:hypothetical protein